MTLTKIQQLEAEIKTKKEELLILKKEQKAEEIEDYTLTTADGNSVKLSSLFGDSDELLVIHNMGKECRYCTMWADGFRGLSEIISDRMPWVLTSPNDPAVLKSFGEARGWNFRTASYAGSDFAFDLGFEKRKEGKSNYIPGVSALLKKDGKIFRTGKDNFGPGDNYNPFWHFMDLFPKGADGWVPKYEY